MGFGVWVLVLPLLSQLATGDFNIATDDLNDSVFVEEFLSLQGTTVIETKPCISSEQIIVSSSTNRPFADVGQDLGESYRITTDTKFYNIDHLHRTALVEEECNKPKLRLTPEAQSKVGSVWFTKSQEIVNGFSTQFRFQFTNPSRICHTKRMLGTKTFIYTRCRDEGSDGLALVIKGLGAEDDFLFNNTVSALKLWTVDNTTLESEILGADGQGIGYVGIPNALAIEFDTFANHDIGDAPMAHVSVHSNARKNLTSSKESLVSGWALPGTKYPTGFNDNKVHTAKIEFIPGLVIGNIYRSKSSSPHTLDLITDTKVDEKSFQFRRVTPTTGTLNVFLDDMSVPIFSHPIDFASKFDLLDGGRAIIGFTASTGRRWQNSYILDWTFCEGRNCHQYVSNTTQSCSIGSCDSELEALVRTEKIHPSILDDLVKP